MPNNKEHLIELIFKKLKKNKYSSQINLEKKEFTEFINYLLSNN